MFWHPSPAKQVMKKIAGLLGPDQEPSATTLHALISDLASAGGMGMLVPLDGGRPLLECLVERGARQGCPLRRDLVRSALVAGADPWQPTHNSLRQSGWKVNAMFQAIRLERFDILKDCLRHAPNPPSPEHAANLWSAALCKDSQPAASILLAHGVPVTTKNQTSSRPLSFSIQSPEMASFLRQRVPDFPWLEVDEFNNDIFFHSAFNAARNPACARLAMWCLDNGWSASMRHPDNRGPLGCSLLGTLPSQIGGNILPELSPEFMDWIKACRRQKVRDDLLSAKVVECVRKHNHGPSSHLAGPLLNLLDIGMEEWLSPQPDGELMFSAFARLFPKNAGCMRAKWEAARRADELARAVPSPSPIRRRM